MDGDAWAIEMDGELAGWLGFTEETEPEYRSVGLDISLSGRFQGQGLGPDALRTAIRWFAARARPPPLHDRPERAQRAGDQGLRGRRLQADRHHAPLELVDGEWTDGLLMDLLIEELT